MLESAYSTKLIKFLMLASNEPPHTQDISPIPEADLEETQDL